ncbi:Ankyrin-3 [Dactylella cylindrospora]|nr:Ankyrin-3 [Dactylella cylindrospora]
MHLYDGRFAALQRLVSLGVQFTNFVYPKPTPVLRATIAADGELQTLELILSNGGEQIINIPGLVTKDIDLFYNDDDEDDDDDDEEEEEKEGHIMTPLGYAARQGDLLSVTLLLSRGAAVDYCAPGEPSPLEWAALYGRFDTVKLLLNAGSTLAREALALTAGGNAHTRGLLQNHIHSTSTAGDKGRPDPVEE